MGSQSRPSRTLFLLCVLTICTAARAEAQAPIAVQVATGGSHSCALDTDGSVFCWGENGSGQLGHPSLAFSRTPVRVEGLTELVAAIAVGAFHTCALTLAGAVKCWGSNSLGVLGDGTTIDRSTPMNAIGLGAGVTAIAAGSHHTCAVLTDGRVKCWGSNNNGKLGDDAVPTWWYRSTPGEVVGLPVPVVAVATGGSHTCVIDTAGGVWCWGANQSGQLGDGTMIERHAPGPVQGLASGVTQVAGGFNFTCALIAGTVNCWGRNTLGELGDGTAINRPIPGDVIGLGGPAAAVTTGGYHACALLEAGNVKCWGHNEYGQLGDGTTNDRPIPVQVLDVSGTATSISMDHGHHTCVIADDDRVLCWGANWAGQLGDGLTEHRSRPVAVIGFGPAFYQFAGLVSQVPDRLPIVPGTGVRIDVLVDSELDADVEDGIVVMPLYPGTTYVEGSATGNARPITAAELRTLDLGSLAKLAGPRAPGETAALIYQGPIYGRGRVAFSGDVRVATWFGKLRHRAYVLVNGGLVATFASIRHD